MSDAQCSTARRLVSSLHCNQPLGDATASGIQTARRRQSALRRRKSISASFLFQRLGGIRKADGRERKEEEEEAGGWMLYYVTRTLAAERIIHVCNKSIVLCGLSHVASINKSMSTPAFSCPFCRTRQANVFRCFLKLLINLFRLKPGSDIVAVGKYRGQCPHCSNSVSFRAKSTSNGVQPLTSVTFRVNDTSYTVENASPSLTLNDWLKSQPSLKGTKHMCREGGCGACVVALTRNDPITKKETTIAVNSVIQFFSPVFL